MLTNYSFLFNTFREEIVEYNFADEWPKNVIFFRIKFYGLFWIILDYLVIIQIWETSNLVPEYIQTLIWKSIFMVLHTFSKRQDLYIQVKKIWKLLQMKNLFKNLFLWMNNKINFAKKMFCTYFFRKQFLPLR